MPTITDTEIRAALSAIRHVEPTDADVRRATVAAPPRARRHHERPRLARVAIAAVAAAVAIVAVAGLPFSGSERASGQAVLLGAAAVAAEQPAMPADGYRYAKLVSRLTRASMIRGCASCIGSVTWEQDNEQWSPPVWREGRRRYGVWRIVDRAGDEQRQRALTADPLHTHRPRLLPDPSLQDIPFADLPTDPEALRDLLQAAVLDLRWAGRARDALAYERDELNDGKPPTPRETRSLLIAGVVSMLGDAHITPRLRSALFGVLATIDGVRALGRVTDPLGRDGEGVAFDIDYEDAHVDHPALEQRIIFAPDTSELLTVSLGQRDPNERPVLNAALKDREHRWISDMHTVYVRTGDVQKIGERP